MLKKIKSFATKKRTFWLIGIIVVLGILWLVFGQRASTTETITIKKGEFIQQVSVSGKVIASENLDLSFEQAGIVRQVLVKVGDPVEAGKFMAGQDISQLSAQLSETQAGLDLQKARLNQLLAGDTPANIKVAEDEVALAVQNLNDTYENAIIELESAYTTLYNTSSVVLSIQNSYFYSADQQSLKVQDARLVIASDAADAKVYLDQAKASRSSQAVATAIMHIQADLTRTHQQLSTIRDQCDIGIYYSAVTASDKTTLDTQKATVNTSLSSVTSSQQSISSYKIALQKAQNNLESVKSPPRETDIAVYQAQIKQAQASLQNIVSQIHKRQIFSPIKGIVSKVNAKVGTVSNANEVAISVISSNNFEIESYVPQIYISSVKVADEGDISLDAFGQGRIFKAKVISIDPSETLKDGVSTYKTTLSFVDYDSQIKDGMTANVLITTDKKSDTISIPQGLIINQDGKKFVKVKEGKNIVQKEVQTGEFSSSGQVEITSGLSDGEVLFVK